MTTLTKWPTRVLAVAGFLALLPTMRAGTTYFSNGDPNSSWVSLGFNNVGPLLDRRFYEEFTVTDPAGITVTGLWSNNFIPQGSAGSFSDAEYSIHTLMTPVDDGTDIATGMASVILTPNGQSFSNTTNFVTGAETQVFDGYQFLVGLNIFLAPGTYSFAVTPHLEHYISCYGGKAGCSALIEETGGANAIGTPVGNKNGMWRDGDPPNEFRANLGVDLALGVEATTAPAVPEPGSAILMGAGMIALSLFARRRIRH